MNQDVHRRLEDLLDREIDLAGRLAATLAAERAELTGPSADAVAHRAAEKMDLIKTLEGLEVLRRALAAATGEAVQASREAPLPGAAATVADRWRTLLESMRKCRTANEVNGYIINLRRGQIQQLLGIVRGGAPVTYTAQGKTFHRALRALARA
jgi:flagellar biosynthesis/type III secretory pathway chaperone